MTPGGGKNGGRESKGRGKTPISVRESSAHLVSKGTTRPPPAPTRRFSLEDEEWIARLAGEGYGGTGALAPGFLTAVRFYRADAPETPLRETLLPRGRFESLYDEELRTLFRDARPLEGGRDQD